LKVCVYSKNTILFSFVFLLLYTKNIKGSFAGVNKIAKAFVGLSLHIIS
jgi:hypothetical protein